MTLSEKVEKHMEEFNKKADEFSAFMDKLNKKHS